MDLLLGYSETFRIVGNAILLLLLCLALLSCAMGFITFFSPQSISKRFSGNVLLAMTALFTAGFLWIVWFHYQIHNSISLELPEQMATWLNAKLNASNQGASFGMPLYNLQNPPRFNIPFWIENEKYYFWFFCAAAMTSIAHFRLTQPKIRAVLQILLALQVALLFFVTDPFTEPLPRFFSEINPWFSTTLSPMERIGLFMQIYPRMIFYYNAHYMWFHPPLLFLAYSCISITFVTSVFMLFRRDVIVEQIGYGFAKFGYLMLTLGMLLGYPWALQAWGPNWWWDPKICSSIMMWLVYGTYLHTRLYANKRGMWYFSSALGILCFVAMLFTFLSTFFFPGEHTLQ